MTDTVPPKKDLRASLNELKSLEKKAETNSVNITRRVQNVFAGHNKPLERDHEIIQKAAAQGGGSSKNTILSEYLCKENTRKERSLIFADANLKSKKHNTDAKIEDEAHQIKLKKRELKRNYLSTLSTKFNPDIIVGKGAFIRGTEYFA